MGKLSNTNTPVSALWLMAESIPNFTNAMCKGHSKPLWDYQLNDDEKLVARGRRHNKAIKLCRLCDHQDECYLWAVNNKMQGVWGGRVLVPDGRVYLRCQHCVRPMIRSRYQKPPRGFRNRRTDTVCVSCHTYLAKKNERLAKRAKRREDDLARVERREARLAKKMMTTESASL